MRIGNSHAIITGASSGIGRAIALELASKGARLTLASRDRDRLGNVTRACRDHGIRAEMVETDVTLEEDCRDLVARASELMGEVDLLVCAAGFGSLSPAREMTSGEIDEMIQTNFLGAVRCTLPLLDSMVSRGHGGLVYVSSILGVMGTEGMSGYAASKFALNGWAEGLRDEVLDAGVFVTLICPGTTETSFFERADRSQIPGASLLLRSLTPEKVAIATRRAIEREQWRVILPIEARLFMRFREIAPRTAHFLMRKVSRIVNRRKH